MALRPPLRHLAATLTILAAVSLPRLASADGRSDAPNPTRPRIGLALGGGSARGLSFVGVLEWLREHRIPVDAVAGTSVGGLIGGVYAVGMTASEIRTLTEEIDWNAVLASEAPFEDKTFRRKQDRRAFPAPIQFGVRRGLWLPRSLNPGQRVALLLDRLTLPYSALPSFDDLPTPFRCVAFDINRSESVVLNHGVLAEAMRATMALPAIFPPVTIDGRLLVDGGFLDNVPADVARQMDVDVVIAVDVGRSPTSHKDVTALSMVGRAIDAVMAAGTKRSIGAADVVITPDMTDLTAIDWNKASAMRERGYRAAEARAEALLAYVVSETEYDAYEAARLARRRTGAIVPTSVVVTGLNAADQATVAEQITARAGRPLDLDELANDLLLLSGTDRFELLTCHLAAVPGGSQLVLTAVPKPNGPAFLTLGVEINNIDASNFAMNVAGRTTIYDAAGRGSEVRFDFVLGTRLGASVEVYRPFIVPWLFAAPRALVSYGTRNLFVDDRLVGEYGLTRGGGGLDVGVTAGRSAELRVGAELVHTDAGLRVGDPLLPEASGWERSASMQFVFDGQDSPVVPSKGTYARAGVRHFFAASSAVGDPAAVASIDSPQQFDQAEFDTITFVSPTRKNRIFTRIAGGTSFDAHPYFHDFSLGGPFRMSAFRNDELRGANFGFASVGYMRQLPRLPAWAGGHAYVAVWAEAGSAFESHATATWHSDLAAGLIVDSLIGPIFAGGSAGPEGHHRLYISLGPLFR
jgi:NTE family protein